MEIACAGCECVVDRGVRIVVCADEDCCCSELAVGEAARRLEQTSKDSSSSPRDNGER